ncbi:hypothetical protein [Streptomyces sp. NPDC055036]
MAPVLGTYVSSDGIAFVITAEPGVFLTLGLCPVLRALLSRRRLSLI